MGNHAVFTAKEATAIVSVSCAVAVCAGPPESFTDTVSDAASVTLVGVPVMAPFAASERPAGSVPLVRVHVYGAVPPVAVRVAL